jgi:cell division protein FtsB
MDFKKKQKSENYLKEFFIKVLAIFIIFVLIFLVIVDVKIYKKRKKLEEEVVKYEKQIQEIKEKNKNLEERITNSDNLDYIEKVAREEQDMQKPGEKVISFVMPKEESQKESYENVWNVKNWLGWISNFWNWIINLI